MEHVKTVYNAFKDARRALGIDAVCLADEFSLRRLRLTGQEDYILKYQAPMDMGMGEKYIDVHAGSMETAVIAKYFPDHVNTALAKKLKRTKLTIDDLKVLGGTGKTTRKLIPGGYFGNPAGYPAVEVEKHINAEVKSAADVILGYLKKK